MSAPRIEPGRTVFLDRDGTINESAPEGEYVTSPEAMRLIPGAGDAVRMLNEHPVKVVVVTNQRGIALGKMSEADLAAIHRRLVDDLAGCGAHLDGIFHCPHQRGACDCRKPETGMFERAAREIEGVEIGAGAMIGDSAIDIEAGAKLGLTTVRLGATGEGDPVADLNAPSLLEAVGLLLADSP